MQTGRQFTPPPPTREVGHGVGGRLKEIGKGILHGAALGSRSGGMGVIGGAIAGGVWGGVNPKNMAKYEHNEIDMPRWEHTHARESQDAEQEDMSQYRRGNQEQQGQELAYRNRALDANVADRQADNARQDSANKFNENLHGENLARQNMALWDQRHPGEPYPKHITDFYPALAGKSAPKSAPKQPIKPYLQTKTGRDGVEYGLREDGTWETTKDATGKPFTPQSPDSLRRDEFDYRKGQDKIENDRKAAAEGRAEDQAYTSGFEKAADLEKKSGEALKRATQADLVLQAGIDPSDKDGKRKLTAEQRKAIEEDRDQARQEANTMKRSAKRIRGRSKRRANGGGGGGSASKGDPLGIR